MKVIVTDASFKQTLVAIRFLSETGIEVTASNKLEKKIKEFNFLRGLKNINMIGRKAVGKPLKFPTLEKDQFQSFIIF